MKIKTLIIVLLLFILSLSANAGGTTGVKPSPAYVNQELEFYISLDDSLNSDYGILLQLGDGGGGWSNDKIMTAKNNYTYFYYNRIIENAGINRKWRYTAYRLSDGAKVQWYERTYTVNEEAPINGSCGNADNQVFVAGSTSYGSYVQCSQGSSSDTTFPSTGSSTTWSCSGSNGGSSASCSASTASFPQLESFSANTSTPKKFAPITLTARTDISVSSVQFKCGGGSWFTGTSSNSGKKWEYTREAGLKSDASCYVDINGDENSDGTVNFNVTDPKFNITKSVDSPTVNESVTFTVSTDKIVETDYKVQIKFLNTWFDMSPSSNRNSWTKDRSFSSAGSKTVYFRIVNSSNNVPHSTSTTLTVKDVVVVPQLESFSANTSTPKKFAPITLTARTDISVSSVQFKCGGGSWFTGTSSNSGKKWEYTREAGLKSDASCYVDINGDENSDGTVNFNVTDPKFNITKSVDSPTVNESVTFTVSTDKIVETDYKVQIKFLNTWFDMSPSSNRNSWTKDRSFSSAGSKTVYFRIVNSSNNVPYSTSSTLTVKDIEEDTKPTITVKTNPIVSGSSLTASIETTDDKELKKLFFSIFDSNKVKLNTKNNISVVSPSLVAYTENTTLLTVAKNSQQFSKEINSQYGYSWGYIPSSKSVTTNWNIDISGLNDGTYYIKYYADDGFSTHIKGTDYMSFIKSTTILNGTCGTANNRTFNSNTISYSIYTQCETGTSSNINFPDIGKTITWNCEGSNGGSIESCSASRENKSSSSNPILYYEGSLNHTLMPNNTEVSLTLWANDIDNDISYIEVDWYDDGLTNIQKKNIKNNEKVTFSFTYPSEINKKYAWSAYAYDNEGNLNQNKVEGTVNINPVTWLISDTETGYKYQDGDKVSVGNKIKKLWKITNNSGIDWVDYKVLDCGNTKNTKNCSEVASISILSGKFLEYDEYYNLTKVGIFKKYYIIKDNYGNILVSQNNINYPFFSIKINVIEAPVDTEVEQLEKELKTLDTDYDNLYSELESLESNKLSLETETERNNNEYAKNISDRLQKYGVFDLDKDDNCLLLEKDGTCDSYATSIKKIINKKIEHFFNDEIPKYKYSLKVEYAFNKSKTNDNYPAKVSLISKNTDFPVEIGTLTANNSKHLLYQAIVLSESFKDYIDKNTKNIDPKTLNKTYELSLSGYIDYMSKKYRVVGAVNGCVTEYSKEIYQTADKSYKNIRVAIKTDDNWEKAEYYSRAIYQVPLGAFIAISNCSDGAITGSLTDDENEKLNNIVTNGYSSLSDESKAIIEKVQNNIEGADEETKALVNLAFMKFKTIQKFTKKIKITNIGFKPTISFKNALKKNKFLNNLSKAKFSGVRLTRISGRLAQKRIKLSGSVKRKAKKVLELAKTSRNKAGELQEKLINNFLEKIYKKDGFKPYHKLSKYGNGDNGFDGVLIKESLANPQKVIIIESKPYKSGFTLNKANPPLPIQLTDKWIDYVVQKLKDTNIKDKIDLAKAIKKAKDKGNLEKIVSGIDRQKSLSAEPNLVIMKVK